MTDRIKKINRALLELELGILFWGVVVTVVGSFFFQNKGYDIAALWIGVVLAMLGAYHMYRTIDSALDFGEKAPQKVVAASMIRYVALIIVMLIVIQSGYLNPLLTFLGVMLLKVASYTQPFTHRFCNYIFHETDPVAMPMEPEEDEKTNQS